VRRAPPLSMPAAARSRPSARAGDGPTRRAPRRVQQHHVPGRAAAAREHVAHDCRIRGRSQPASPPRGSAGRDPTGARKRSAPRRPHSDTFGVPPWSTHARRARRRRGTTRAPRPEQRERRAISSVTRARNSTNLMAGASGLVSGPSRLNAVRLQFLRTETKLASTGCIAGAKRKAMPAPQALRQHLRTCRSGSRRAPRRHPRFRTGSTPRGCRAWPPSRRRPPHHGGGDEMLKLPLPSPPVPAQVAVVPGSDGNPKRPLAASRRRETDDFVRKTLAFHREAPPAGRRPAGARAPSRRCRPSRGGLGRRRGRPSPSPSAARPEHLSARSSAVRNCGAVTAFARQDRLRVELDACTGQARWRRPMTTGHLRPGGDLELVRPRVFAHRERVIAPAATAHSREHAPAVRARS